jgi:hypothetical protein
MLLQAPGERQLIIYRLDLDRCFFESRIKKLHYFWYIVIERRARLLMKLSFILHSLIEIFHHKRFLSSSVTILIHHSSTFIRR